MAGRPFFTGGSVFFLSNFVVKKGNCFVKNGLLFFSKKNRKQNVIDIMSKIKILLSKKIFRNIFEKKMRKVEKKCQKSKCFFVKNQNVFLSKIKISLSKIKN